MFTPARLALVFAAAICSSALGQSTPSRPYWPANEPYQGPQRPLSGTGVWRYDQSVRRFYEALGRQNQLSAEQALFEIAAIRSADRSVRDEQREVRITEARERLQERRQRQDEKALQLLESIEDGSVVWPLALQNRWAEQRLRDVCVAILDPYATLDAEKSLSEIRRALTEGHLAGSRIEKDRAFRVLVLLERLIAAKQRPRLALN